MPVEVPIPAALLKPCTIPAFPEVVTIGSIQDLIAELYTSLHSCEAQRQSISDRQPEPI